MCGIDAVDSAFVFYSEVESRALLPVIDVRATPPGTLTALDDTCYSEETGVSLNGNRVIEKLSLSRA